MASPLASTSALTMSSSSSSSSSPSSSSSSSPRQGGRRTLSHKQEAERSPYPHSSSFSYSQSSLEGFTEAYPPSSSSFPSSSSSSPPAHPHSNSTRRRTKAAERIAKTPTSSPLSLRSMVWVALSCLLLALALGAEPVKAQSQNETSLTGTWASGSGKVLTGLSFYNPITQNFTLPTSGGISYSFVEDLPGGGHFETSTFTYTSNPGTNRCFTAALTWQHGTFTNNANGSLTLTPYAADGRVQIMDPCAAESTAQYAYSQVELIPAWYNYLETLTGFDNIDGTAYGLQMYNDDGTANAGQPKNVMYLVARPPDMLPTEQIFEIVLNAE